MAIPEISANLVLRILTLHHLYAIHKKIKEVTTKIMYTLTISTKDNMAILDRAPKILETCIPKLFEYSYKEIRNSP